MVERHHRLDGHRFEYEYLIGGKVVKYTYSKNNYRTLVSESFSIGGRELIEFDRTGGNTKFTCHLKGTENLNKEIKNAP